jgi:hypothetical protein
MRVVFYVVFDGELPVQLPVNFQMGINFKAAKALSLTVPQSILLSADEVIERASYGTCRRPSVAATSAVTVGAHKNFTL